MLGTNVDNSCFLKVNSPCSFLRKKMEAAWRFKKKAALLVNLLIICDMNHIMGILGRKSIIFIRMTLVSS